MDLSARKQKLMASLSEIEDEELIVQLEIIINSRVKNDWWYEISEAERAAIRKGLEELERSEGIPHEEVMAKYSKWLKE